MDTYTITCAYCGKNTTTCEHVLNATTLLSAKVDNLEIALAAAAVERDENEGAFKVWRRRCEEAEEKIQKLTSSESDLLAHSDAMQFVFKEMSRERKTMIEEIVLLSREKDRLLAAKDKLRAKLEDALSMDKPAVVRIEEIDKILREEK